MNLGLQDRIAFVAGASSGLGYAVAQALLDEGCRAAICGRDPDRIRQAATDLRDATGAASDRVLPLVCDVTSEPAIEAAMEVVGRRWGGLHVLVTNAGGPPAGYIDDFDAEAWREALELNLMSTINLCRHALPHLRASVEADGHARIVMIASISAKQPIPNLYLSNTSRAGVLGFMKSLAEEEGPRGITVNAVLPGYTRTDRLQDLADAITERTGTSVDEVEAGWAEDTALGRIGKPDEFASTVAYLAGVPAAFITGVALPIDGGHSKHLL